MFKIIADVGSVKTEKAHIKIHRTPDSLDIYIISDLWEDLWQSYHPDTNIFAALFDYIQKIPKQNRLWRTSNKPIDVYYAGCYVITLLPT